MAITDAELARIRDDMRAAIVERQLLRMPCERCMETGSTEVEHILARHGTERGGRFHGAR